MLETWRTLVIVEDISLMVTAGIVGFPDAHGVVGEIDIAVVAWRVSLKAFVTAWILGGLQKSTLIVSSCKSHW